MPANETLVVAAAAGGAVPAAAAAAVECRGAATGQAATAGGVVGMAHSYSEVQD